MRVGTTFSWFTIRCAARLSGFVHDEFHEELSK